MKSCFNKKTPEKATEKQTTGKRKLLNMKIIGRPEDVAELAEKPVPKIPLQIPRLLEPFQPDQFELEAQIVFRFIMGAFAQGWLSPIKDLVTAQVLDALTKAVQERVDKNLTIEFQVYDIDIKVLPDTLTPLHVKVEITSQQYGVFKDKKGTIVSGNPDSLQCVQEIWQFERGAKRWVLSGIEHQ